MKWLLLSEIMTALSSALTSSLVIRFGIMARALCGISMLDLVSMEVRYYDIFHVNYLSTMV